METTEERLNLLRGRWLIAKQKGDTAGMRIIEIQGKLLKAKSPVINRVDRLKEVMEIFEVK
jgi:hypothetical protein